MTFAQHILATTDFSDPATAGVRKAAQVARLTGGKVSLVHVFDPTPLAPIATRPSGMSNQLDDEQGVEDSIRKALDGLRTTVLSEVADVSLHVVQGSNAADEITKWAGEHGVDLIVLSTHGRTGLQHLLIGSVAECVVRHAPCSVLTEPRT